MKTQKYPQSLEAVRGRIAEILAERAACSVAIQPDAEIELEMHRVLGEAVSEFKAFQGRLSTYFAQGDVPSLDFVLRNSYLNDEVARMALGGALANYGVDRFVTESMAAANFPEGQRLTPTERATRLLELDRERYQCELDEESMVMTTRATRRVDCNAAAVIGMPLAVAEQNNLIGLKG